MSYEAYAHHIIQKHRLAVSIAVIKSKPADTSLEDHIQELRDSIENKMEDDITVCSDDFEINETDFEIEEELITQTTETVKFAENNYKTTNEHLYSNKNGTADKFESISTRIIESNDRTDIEMDDTQMSNDSVNILRDFDFGNEVTEIGKLRLEKDDLKKGHKGVGEISNEKITSNKTNVISDEENLTQCSQQLDITQCLTDDDATQCNSIDILANIEHNILGQNHIHNSDNENQLNKYKNLKQTEKHNFDFETTKLHQNQNNNNVKQVSSTRTTEINPEIKMTVNTSRFKNNLIDVKNNNTVLIKYKHTKEFKNICKNVASIFNVNNDKHSNDHIKESNVTVNNNLKKANNNNENVKEEDLVKNKILAKPNDTVKNTQNVIKYDMTQDSTCATHYSQTPSNDAIYIDNKYIHGTKRKVRQAKSKPKKTAPKRKKKSDIVLDKLTNTTETNENSQKKTKIRNCDIPTNSCNVYIYNNENFTNIQTNNAFSDTHTNETANDNQNLNVATTNEDNTQKNSKNVINEYITQNDGNKNKIPDDNSLNKDSSFHDNETFLSTRTENILNSNTNNSTLNANTKDCILNLNYTNMQQQTNATPNNENLDDASSFLHSNLEIGNLNLNAKENIRNTKDNGQNSLNSKENELNSMLNTESDENAKRKLNEILRHLYADNPETETEISLMSPNEIIEHDGDSLGLTDFGNFGNCDSATNYCEIFDKTQNSALFDNNFNIPITDQLMTDFDNSQNIGVSRNGGNQNLENVNQTNYGCSIFDNNVIFDINHTNPECSTIFENNMNIVGSDVNNSVQNVEANVREGSNIFDENLDLETGVSAEKVPFKIIAELNKVKLFLNRNDKNIKMCSGDTGYRSDSNSKNTPKLSQTPMGLDQSAHCLYKYITNCPLVCATQDITEEISLVLGQLIDRLYEEERYPSFLEEMLESVKNILEQIYQQKTDENMLSITDELVDRIILLNKSIHLQKYTIEKITNTLKTLHTELTTNESFEIQNIDKIENSCQIFHLLEIILLKHKKSNENFNQNTQNLSQNPQPLRQNTQPFSQNTQPFSQNTQPFSQNTQLLSQNTQEKLLKKSNIIDIWKKKWNPNYKEVPTEGNIEKKCVISECNKILNKIIVECMEGFSLISYNALKCFNVTQN